MHAAINILYTASNKALLQPCLLQCLYGHQWNLALTAPVCTKCGLLDPSLAKEFVATTHSGQEVHLFCSIRLVINSTLGESASGRMPMQVDKARSPSSRTHLRPALPNNYSMFRSELQLQPNPSQRTVRHITGVSLTWPSGASKVQHLPFCKTKQISVS